MAVVWSLVLNVANVAGTACGAAALKRGVASASAVVVLVGAAGLG